MKTKILLPPPGVFQPEDTYLKKRWRRVQHLANEFWVRWKKEFLQTLQERSKWTKPRRNLQVGDIVLLKDDNTIRNKWKLGRIIESYSDENGFVRSVKLAVGDGLISNKGKGLGIQSILERPIQKLVLLVPTERL